MLCLVGQSCPTLCDPVNCSPLGSSDHGDSPGRNSGVGCHASSRGSSKPRDGSQVSRIYRLSRQGSPWKSLSCVDSLWHSPGKNTGVGSYFLLQGIVPTQRWNPGLLRCRRILDRLSRQGSPRILGWVACPFFSRSSQPSYQTGVLCIAGRFFTSWATREQSNFVEVYL